MSSASSIQSQKVSGWALSCSYSSPIRWYTIERCMQRRRYRQSSTDHQDLESSIGARSLAVLLPARHEQSHHRSSLQPTLQLPSIYLWRKHCSSHSKRNHHLPDRLVQPERTSISAHTERITLHTSITTLRRSSSFPHSRHRLLLHAVIGNFHFNVTFTDPAQAFHPTFTLCQIPSNYGKLQEQINRSIIRFLGHQFSSRMFGSSVHDTN